MKAGLVFHTLILAFCCGMAASVLAQSANKKEEVCFESRKDASEVTKREIKPSFPNVKCSPTTGAVLWYGDPFDGTVPMGKVPQLETIPAGTEGTPVERNLVRNSLQLEWKVSARGGKAPAFFESRPMNIPEGANPDRLRVAGWVQDAQGRIHAMALSRCARASQGR